MQIAKPVEKDLKARRNGILTIRPFAPTDAEYETVVAIANGVWPDDPSTVDHWKHDDKHRDRNYLFQRLVVEVAGKIVAFGAYGESEWSHQPGKYWFDYDIHPDYEGRDLDKAFYNHVMEIFNDREAVTIIAGIRADKADKIRLLTENGFKQVMRSPRSLLDVTTFKRESFTSVLKKVGELGIDIYSLTELQKREADWMRKLYDLEWEILQDIPTPDPLTKPPFAEYKKTFIHPAFRADGWYIGVDKGQCVGMSCIWINEANPNKAYTGLTGVLRSHRRKGLATAMKLQAIAYVQQCGLQYVETDNEENNPMYRLNLRLGFKPAPAWLDFKKVLRENSAESENETK